MALFDVRLQNLVLKSLQVDLKEGRGHLEEGQAEFDSLSAERFLWGG